MYEFYQDELPDSLTMPAGCSLVLDVRTLAAQDSVPAPLLRQGLVAAMAVLDSESLSPYAAYCAAYLVARDMHDAMENPDLSDDTYSRLKDLEDWAIVWDKATDAALAAVLQDIPAGEYEYRFLVDWEGRQPGENDLGWSFIRKREM